MPAGFHEECFARIQAYLQQPLVRRSRAWYSSPDGSLMVTCCVSREYDRADYQYWFVFHPYQKEILEVAPTPYVAFGCGSETTVLLVPFSEFVSWLDGLNVISRFRWSIRVHRENGSIFLLRRPGYEPVDLTRYLLPAEGLVRGIQEPPFMKKYPVALPTALYEDLKALAHRRKTTVAALVRQAVEKCYQDDLDGLLMEQEVAAQAADRSTSVTLEEYLIRRNDAV